MNKFNKFFKKFIDTLLRPKDPFKKLEITPIYFYLGALSAIPFIFIGFFIGFSDIIIKFAETSPDLLFLFFCLGLGALIFTGVMLWESFTWRRKY